MQKPNDLNKTLLSQTSGRFSTLEETALAKNKDLIAHIKKIGLQIKKVNTTK